MALLVPAAFLFPPSVVIERNLFISLPAPFVGISFLETGKADIIRPHGGNMKKATVIVLVAAVLALALGLSAAEETQSPPDPRLIQVLACQSPEEAAKLLPELEKLESDDKDFYLGVIHHNLAANGRPEHIAAALDHFRRAAERKPSALVLGYSGSALTIQAGENFRKNDMSMAMRNLQEGIRRMDASVDQDPHNTVLRALRLENSVALSQNSPINRDDKIKEDLEFFKRAYAALSADMRSFFHLQEARLNLKNKNIDLALRNFEKAVQAAPASVYARQAKEELLRLER